MYIHPKLRLKAEIGKYRLHVNGTKVVLFNSEFRNVQMQGIVLTRDNFKVTFCLGNLIKMEFDNFWPDDILVVLARQDINIHDLDTIYSFLVYEVFLTDCNFVGPQVWH